MIYLLIFFLNKIIYPQLIKN